MSTTLVSYSADDLLAAYPEGAQPPETAANLAEEAERLLGYRAATKALRRRFGQTMDELALLSVLREREVKAFRTEDVERYQQRMIDDAFAPLNRRKRRLEQAATLVGLAFVCLAFWAMGAYIYPGDQAIISEADFFGPLMLGFLLTSLLIVLCWFTDSQIKRTTAEWTLHDIGSYSQPMPTGVLALAVGLKKQVPNCTFSVAEFSVRRRPLDPFLFICLGDASLAIEVWGEPKFDGVLAV
jgi:hypothetical protein